MPASQYRIVFTNLPGPNHTEKFYFRRDENVVVDGRQTTRPEVTLNVKEAHTFFNHDSVIAFRDQFRSLYRKEKYSIFIEDAQGTGPLFERDEVAADTGEFDARERLWVSPDDLESQRLGFVVRPCIRPGQGKLFCLSPLDVPSLGDHLGAIDTIYSKPGEDVVAFVERARHIWTSLGLSVIGVPSPNQDQIDNAETKEILDNYERSRRRAATFAQAIDAKTRRIQMKVLNGYDVDTQERVLTDVPEEAVAFWKEIKASPEWEKFLDEYGNTSENNEIVIGCLNKLYGDEDFTSISHFLDALSAAIDAGELNRKPEPAPPGERPLTRSGVPMTDSQMKWSEYRQFSENNGMEAVRRRAREDAGFAAFVRTNLRREMNEQGVGDATVNLNDRPQSNDHVIPELARWVEEYRRTPVSEVRKKSRADTNPDGYKHFNEMLNLAAAGGLI